MATEGGHTNDLTARRRRIAEKGSDRLALITGGRAPTSSNASCPPPIPAMATEGGHTNDPTARRRRIAEKGSDRLALITGGRAPTSSNASCPPSHTGQENISEIEASKPDEHLRNSESTKTEAASSSWSPPKKPKHEPSTNMKIYLYKTVSPSQLQPAILATQDMRRKCSFFTGIVAVLSYLRFPILDSFIVRSIILSRPLVLLLFINISITIGPLVLDAMKLIEQEQNMESEEVDLPDNLGSPLEWGMLLKAGLSALFMDSCIYSVVVVCATSFFQKFGM